MARVSGCVCDLSTIDVQREVIVIDPQVTTMATELNPSPILTPLNDQVWTLSRIRADVTWDSDVIGDVGNDVDDRRTGDDRRTSNDEGARSHL
jgi:hypothetical protein